MSPNEIGLWSTAVLACFAAAWIVVKKPEIPVMVAYCIGTLAVIALVIIVALPIFWWLLPYAALVLVIAGAVWLGITLAR